MRNRKRALHNGAMYSGLELWETYASRQTFEYFSLIEAHRT